MNKRMVMIITVLIFAVIVAAIVILNKQIEKSDQEQDVKKVSIENQPTIGDPDAPVTIVEFGDYKCPGCGAWSESIYPKLKKDYIDSGKVKFAFINVLFHQEESLLASLASESVYQQDPEAFWDYHEALFAAQPTNQQHDGPWVTPDLLVDLAKEHAPNIDLDQLKKDIVEQGTLAAVEMDNQLVTEQNINSTPSIIVNGVLVNEPFDYNELKELIEKGLK